jgi:hypothetical protein
MMVTRCLFIFLLYGRAWNNQKASNEKLYQISSNLNSFVIAGEITLVRPLDEISAITHIGDPVLLTVIAEEVKVARNEPPAMASTVQLALFLPERSNSPPYFENDQ